VKQSGATELKPKLLSLESPRSDLRSVLLRIQGKQGERAVVISVVQLWANRGGTWKIVQVRRSNPALDGVRTLPEPERPNPNLYPPVADAGNELKKAIAKAKVEGKRVIVVFGANWCYDCHVLDATFHSPQFASLLQSSFEVVHINTGDEGKDNTELAQKLGVGLDKGIPSLAVLDGNGSVLTAQRNGEFESTTRIGPQEVRQFLEEWKPAKRGS
jgi:thiol:disulfide interchange protein